MSTQRRKSDTPDAPRDATATAPSNAERAGAAMSKAIESWHKRPHYQLGRRNPPPAEHRSKIRLSFENGDHSSIAGAMLRSDGTVLTWTSRLEFQFWNPTTGELLGQKRFERPCSATVWRHNDRTLVIRRPGFSLQPAHWHAEASALPFKDEELVDDVFLVDELTRIAWTDTGNYYLLRDSGELEELAPFEKTQPARWVALLSDGTVLIQGEAGDVARFTSTPWRRVITRGGPMATQPLSDGSVVAGFEDGVLRRYGGDSGALIAELEGYEDHLEGIQELKDGSLLSWNRGGTIYRWNLEANRCSARLREHEDRARGALELPNGELISWSSDATLRRWDSKTGELLATYRGHTDEVRSALRLHDDLILSRSLSELCLWRLGATRPLASFSWSEGFLVGDKSSLSRGSVIPRRDESDVIFWDESFHERLGAPDTFGRFERIDGAILISRNDSLQEDVLLTWLNTGRVAQWLFSTSSTINEALERGVRGARYLGDGAVAVWTNDGLVRLYRAATGACFATLQGAQNGAVDGVYVLANGELLTYATDGTLRRWNTEREELLRDYRSHDDALTAVFVLESGELFGTSERALMLWDIETGATLARSDSKSAEFIWGKRLSPSILALLDRGAHLYLFDLEATAPLSTRCLSSPIGQTPFLLRDQTVLAKEIYGDLVRFDPLGGGVIAKFSCSEHVGLEGAQLLADGTLCLVERLGGEAELWDAERGQRLLERRGVALPDGFVIVVSHDGGIACFELETGDARWSHKIDDDSFTGVKRLGVDQLLTTSRSGALRRWDLSGQCLALYERPVFNLAGGILLPKDELFAWTVDGALHVFEASSDASTELDNSGHTGEILGTVLLRDGSLLSHSTDGTLRLWNVIEGRCSAVLRGHTGAVNGAIELEGGVILSWSEDGTIRRWVAKEGRCLGVTLVSQRPIEALFRLRNGDVITWANSELRRWCATTGERRALIQRFRADIVGVEFFPYSQTVLLLSAEDKDELWNLERGRRLLVFDGTYSDFSQSLVELTDGTLITWQDGGPPWRVCRETGACDLLVPESDDEDILHGLFVLSDDTILLSDRRGGVRRVNAEGETITDYVEHPKGVTRAVRTVDGDLLTYSVDKKLRSSSYESGELLETKYIGEEEDLTTLVWAVFEMMNGSGERRGDGWRPTRRSPLLMNREHGVVHWDDLGSWRYEGCHTSGVFIYRSFRDLAFLELCHKS